MHNQIKFTTVKGTIVSTIAHSEPWMGRGYETGIFYASGEQRVKTYTTRKDAMRGHDCIVKMLGGI